MELRIDTAKDSKEDIRKAIRLLQSLVDDRIEDTAPQQDFPTGENVLGGFFDAPDTAIGQESKPMEPVSAKPVPKERISLGKLDVY
jgi:hypothetical protein